MCCKRQTLKKRTHNARVAGEILVETRTLRNGCWVQLNAIRVAKPLSLFVETHGTEQGLTADEITNVLNKEGGRNPGPLAVCPTLRAPRISAGVHLGHSTIHSSARRILRRIAKSVVKSGTSKSCCTRLPSPSRSSRQQGSLTTDHITNILNEVGCRPGAFALSQALHEPTYQETEVCLHSRRDTSTRNSRLFF